VSTKGDKQACNICRHITCAPDKNLKHTVLHCHVKTAVPPYRCLCVAEGARCCWPYLRMYLLSAMRVSPSGFPPKMMSVPRPAMLVAIVTEHGNPACATTYNNTHVYTQHSSRYQPLAKCAVRTAPAPAHNRLPRPMAPQAMQSRGNSRCVQ
jgi:hypothetical protein